MWRRFLFRRRRSSYPLAGCSPAEPASVSLDDEKLADSSAGSIVGLFKICGASIAEGAVQALAVVKDFDVIEERLADLIGVLESAPVDQLQFERAPEGLHRGVVVAVGLAAHRGNHLRGSQRLARLLSGFLLASVGWVMKAR